jgi:D-glycero-D-manno-heptose 1,7-bisphosphate phosphatase
MKQFKKKKAVFLDRDNTIIKDNGYTHKVEDFETLPNAIEGMSALHDAGFLLIVITNQSGIGRGYYNKSDVHKFHKHMHTHFKKKGIEIADFCYCGHHPDDRCLCRKPSPIMIENAIKKFDIEKSLSWMVGDRDTDIDAGHNAGVSTIHIYSENNDPVDRAHYTAIDLLDASAIIKKR